MKIPLASSYSKSAVGASAGREKSNVLALGEKVPLKHVLAAEVPIYEQTLICPSATKDTTDSVLKLPALRFPHPLCYSNRSTEI